MVQGIENLATLAGTILAVERHPRLDGWSQATLQLESVEPLTGPPGLWEGRSGRRELLAVRTGLLDAAAAASGQAGGVSLVGAHLRCTAQQTADGLMCQPYPEDGTFTLG